MSDQFDPYHVWLGIPPEEQPPNHYRLLGLRPLEGDRDVISNALDQRLVFLRTFQAGKRGALSQKLLNEVSAAGVVLLNAEKKVQYDRDLSNRPDNTKPQKSSHSLPVARPIAPAPAPSAVLPEAVIPVLEPEAVLPGMASSSRSDWEAHASFAGAPPSTPSFPATKAEPALADSSLAGWQPTGGPRPASMPAGRRQAAGLPLLAIIGGGLAVMLLVAAVVGGLWFAGRQVADVDVSSQPVTNASPADLPAPEDPPENSDTAISQPAVVQPEEPFAKSASNQSAAGRQIWMADAPEKRVFRKTDTGWIDYRERDEFRYQQRFLSRDSVGLWESVRQVAVDLYDDRLEVHSAEAAPAIVCKGRWISADELPDFAKRPAASKRPDPLAWRSSTWDALVFDGQSSALVPMPPEIAGPGADFTIEMWVRFEAGFPESRLITAGPLELHTKRPKTDGAGPRSMLMADIKSGPLGIAFPAPVLGGKWHHWALVRAGKNLRLFFDGQPRVPLPVDDSFALGQSPLSLGGLEADSAPKLHGLIRDLRISQGARYSGVFRPPLRFVTDEQTLVLPKFTAAASPTIEDFSGRSHHAQRNSAQWLPLTQDEGIVQAELPAGHIDLMRAFTSSLHTVRGASQRTVADAKTTSAEGIAQVLIPYLAPPDYDLELELTRDEGEGGVLFGLVLGPNAKQVALAVNAFSTKGGPLTGILPSDLQTVAPGGNLTKHPAKLVTGQRHRVNVQVRHVAPDRFTVNVAIDGASVHATSDALASISLSPSLSLPQRATMFWGSHDAKIRFHAMRLTPAGGRGTMVAGAANVTPRVNNNPPNNNPPSTNSSPSAAANAASPLAPAARLPVPAADELARRVESARKIFQEQFKEATKPAQKAALARTILSTANDTQSDPTARYVLTDLARKVFVQAAEVDQALAAARVLEKEFEVPQNEIVYATLEALDEGTLPPEQRATLAKTAISLADDLVADDQFAQAEKLATIASQSAGKQRDADLRKDIQQRRAQIVRIATAAKGVAASLTLLATQPDDKAANLAVGKFRCFVLEDWDAGLPNLASGGDPLFTEPARLDLAASSGGAAAQVAAGEAWVKLAGDAKAVGKDDRPAIQQRARELLTSALGGLEGLDKVSVERTLKDLPAAQGTANKRAAKSRAPRAQAAAGLIGRVSVRNRDVGILVTYQPGYRISDADVAKLAAAAGVMPGDPWRVDFVGVLSLAVDAQVETRHIGGSTSGGVHTLYIDNQRISEIGDDRSKNDTSTRPFQAGAHVIRWVLTGGDLGTASVQFNVLDTRGQAVPAAAAVHHTREMNAAVRQTAVRSEFNFAM